MAAESGMYKVALCGKSDVGKTSILTRMSTNEFWEDTSKINDEYRSLTVRDSKGRPVKIQLWDTLGMERYANLTRRHYINSKVVLLVYSCDDMGSLEVLKDYYDTSIKHATGAKMVLVRNKTDLDFKVVDENEAIEKLCGGGTGRHRQFCYHLSTSAKRGTGIEELCTELGNLLCNTEPAIMKSDPFGAFRVGSGQSRPEERTEQKQQCCS